MNEIYAAFIEDSYHVEGDERSRTNPGHGYPAHTVSYTSVETFNSIGELKEWVTRQEKQYHKKAYKIYRCEELVVYTSTEIKIG